MTAPPWDNGQTRPGFGKIRYYGGEYWGGPDPQRDEMLSRASVPSTARLVRSVIEHTPLGLFSNQDGGTLGAARFAGGSDVSLLRSLADLPALPPDARATFGAAAAPTAASSATRRAWYNYARTKPVQRAYWARWFDKVLIPAYNQARSLGWRSELGVAILARARNSSPAAMSRAVAAARRAVGERAQVEAALAQYASERPLYAERAAELRAVHPWTALDRAPSADDLYLDARPRRPDGTPVGTLAATSPTRTILLSLAAALAVGGGAYYLGSKP